MDLPKKRSNSNLTGIYAFFIFLLAFTVFLFATSKFEDPPHLAKQDTAIKELKNSEQNIRTVKNKISPTKELSENKTEAIKSKNAIDDENSDFQPSKNDSSIGKKKQVDIKAPSFANQSSDDNPIRKQSPVISSEQKMVIYFSKDSTGLTKNALQKLKVINELFLQYPYAEMAIEGYGDLNSNYQHEKTLSQLRADIVKNYFIKQGIAETSIKCFWIGSENPTREKDDLQEDSKKSQQVVIKFKMRSTDKLKN